MDINVLLMQVILGAVLGAVGQGARVIVGLKKLNDEVSATGKQFKDEFSASSLVVSLIIGAVAGVLAIIGAVGIESELMNRESMMAVIASGYAGADFIEGFMKKAGNIPAQLKPSSSKSA